MSGGEGRKLSNQDIQLVQNRIEQCLQHYMNKKEVINALIIQDNIEPCITELGTRAKPSIQENSTVNDQADHAVALALDYARDMILIWQRLEEENQEFFKAYYLKLLVKDQIMEFNKLLSEQVELMRRVGLSGIAPFTSNGSHVSPTQHIPPTQNARPLKTEGMQQANMFHNCGSSVQDGPLHGRKIDVSGNLFLSQNSNVGLAQMMNGKSVKTEAGYAGSSPFAFSPPTNYLESRALMGDASVSSFSSVDSNAQHLNEPLLDGDTSSFGFLAQIPPSFPDLTTDFATSSDLLESYCRPPFLPTDANNFVNPHGDIESLDPESESLRFQCFGAD